MARDDLDAADFAAAQVAAVRDDPVGRLALARSMYEDPIGGRAPRLRFQRAAFAFMRWMSERGVLAPLDGPRPGSRWWRAMNERILRDSCEALGRAAGHGGPLSADTVERWTAFVETPTAQAWYRAHNASVVAAYLEHRALAADENRVERASWAAAVPFSPTRATAASTSSSRWDGCSPTATPPEGSSRTTCGSSASWVARSTTR